jgi:predicted TIM-barrel fold metal-dependent hydrolase
VVIDFRVQPPHRSFLDLHFFRPRPAVEDPVHGNPFAVGRGPNPSFAARSLELFVAELDAAGVERAVIVGQRAAARWGSASNDDIVDVQRRHPGRFAAVGGVDPVDPAALDETERVLDRLGMIGVALVNGWSDPPVTDDDDRVMPVYEACARRGRCVVVTSSHFIGPDQAHSMPVHLDRVATAFPDLRLIVGHAAWPWTVQAVALAMKHTNVYLMPEFYMYLPGMPGAEHYVAAANTFLRHRMLFSSCYPSRTVAEALAGVEALPLVPESREALLHGNAARLLGELEGRR